EDIQRRRDLRVMSRVAVGHAPDEQPKCELRGAGGESGQHRGALKHPVRLRPHPRDLMKMVHKRDRAESRLLGCGRDFDELVEDLVFSGIGVIEVWKVEVECDWSAHRFSVAAGKSHAGNPRYSCPSTYV